MIIQWIFFLFTGNVPELITTPISISFHIFIEILTAVMLIITFTVLKGTKKWGKYFAIYTQGMLGYTTVNSAGYFAQSSQWILLIMFAVILLFSIYNTYIIVRQR